MVGKDKQGKSLNLYFSTGLNGKDASSVPHHVKNGDKVFKLNPLEV